jgi:hypothetical protein
VRLIVSKNYMFGAKVNLTYVYTQIIIKVVFLTYSILSTFNHAYLVNIDLGVSAVNV